MALLVVGAAHLASPSAAASKAKPVPCADGAFQVQGAPLVAGAVTPQASTLRLKTASSPAIDIGCGPPSAARVVSKRTFDQVTAKWKRCGSLTRVRLSAKLAKPDCGRLVGVVKAKKATARQFVAQRFSCGDGTLDVASEACDASAAGGDAACPGRCSSLCVCNAVATTTTTITVSTSSTSTTTTTAPCVPTSEVCDGLDNDCDGTTDDGVVDDGSDLCVLAHASTECSGGSCKVLSCDGTFANCDKQAGNGCEIDRESDPSNCGACGTACSAANRCAGGVCAAVCNGQPGANCVTVEDEALGERTNDSADTAIPIVIGGTIDGTIGDPIDGVADNDLYAFDAVAGDVLRATISNRGGAFEARATIGDVAQGVEIRRIRPGDEDTSLATREFVIPRSGKYVLWIQDLRNETGANVGGVAFTYRAKLSRVTRTPDPATFPLEHEPASVPATGDVVLLSFDALEGQDVSAATFAQRLETPSKVDTILLLFDTSTTPPTLLAENDDHDGTLDSLIGITAPMNGSLLLVVDTFDVTGILPADRQYDLTVGTPCFHCAESLGLPPESPDAFCPGSFGRLTTVLNCLCGEAGACQAQCVDFCAGAASETCDACASDPGGCLSNLDPCRDDTAPNVCGDRFVRGDEGCDDGNLTSGDGCSDTCAIEPGFTCVGRPSSCGSCSDGIPNGSETDVDCGGGCPACGLTKACTRSQDCSSGSCQNGTCGCPETFHLFTLDSSVAGIFETAQWPGGTQTFAATPECSVKIANPSGAINSPLGDSFAVTQVVGFSACFGVGGEDADGCEPTSCPPLGIGSCLQARPMCTLAGNGSGSARYGVECLR